MDLVAMPGYAGCSLAEKRPPSLDHVTEGGNPPMKTRAISYTKTRSYAYAKPQSLEYTKHGSLSSMRARSLMSLAVLALLSLPQLAFGITEEKSGKTYPDEITVESNGEPVTLIATGTALREKTFMKVDVYTIVSYVEKGTDLGSDPAAGLIMADVPKRLQMDLRRGFSRDKLIGAFEHDIEKNYGDKMDSFADAMKTFKAYWTRDAQDKDLIIFDYDPATGLHTSLNGEELGVIQNPVFAQALWSVWFGKDPASKDMKKHLLSAIQE